MLLSRAADLHYGRERAFSIASLKARSPIGLLLNKITVFIHDNLIDNISTIDNTIVMNTWS